MFSALLVEPTSIQAFVLCEPTRQERRLAMKSIVTERGQITTPKTLRYKLGIDIGTLLAFTAENRRHVVTKRMDSRTIFQLLGRRNCGGRTFQVMNEFRDKTE